jgi:hypothetical protein
MKRKQRGRAHSKPCVVCKIKMKDNRKKKEVQVDKKE